MTRAAVFAYHDVGVRCLSVLLAHGVDVGRVYTHADDPHENIWFGSVERLARDYGIPVTLVGDAGDPAIAATMAALAPDFLFSFYYRFMLPPAVLALARHGAYNMHGSLLPRYRGRVPINWAIIHGERETGATLHEMTAKPDAGRIAAQRAVPILPNDTAADVFRKVMVAAELTLDGILPSLLDGTLELRAQDLTAGSYHGGRKPEDGRINWSWGASQVHNLVRAVAPPYPGAFATVRGRRLEVLGTLNLGQRDRSLNKPALMVEADGHAGGETGNLVLRCTDGGVLRVTRAVYDGQPLAAANFAALLGPHSVALD